MSCMSTDSPPRHHMHAARKRQARQAIVWDLPKEPAIKGAKDSEPAGTNKASGDVEADSGGAKKSDKADKDKSSHKSSRRDEDRRRSEKKSEKKEDKKRKDGDKG